MRKCTCFLITVLFLFTGCEPAEESSIKHPIKTTIKQSTQPQLYEAILYELGAFPVKKLTKEYFTNGNPGQVYSKGDREDVHGWLRPFWARTDSYLTESEKKHYGIPKKTLNYGRYVSFLDVEAYQQTKDPLQFAIIQFTLEEFLYRKIKIKNPEDILKVYHAKMGLDNLVLRTLKGRGLTGPMVASLYRQYQDPLLFRYFTPPDAGQKEYKSFLEQLLEDKQIDAAHRFDVYTLLYQADKKNLAGYKEFIFQNISQLPEWYDRYKMYEALVSIGDGESIKMVNHALLNDPIADVRRFLIHDLVEQQKVDEYIATIHLLSLGKGKKYVGVFAPNSPPRQTGETLLTQPLKTYLKWAKQKKNLKQETQMKIQSALQALTLERPNSTNGPFGGGDFFGPNKNNRK